MIKSPLAPLCKGGNSSVGLCKKENASAVIEKNSAIQKELSIAILGGTFDPIHNGHLECAYVLHQDFGFKKILFIPCKQNPLKADVNANTQQRIDMIELAIKPFSESYFCDLRDVERDTMTHTYTIDTLKSLRKNYPHASIAFSMGVDSFNTLEQWEEFEDFLTYVHIIVFPRPGYTLKPTPVLQTLINKSKTEDIQPLHTHPNGYIYFSDKPEHMTSSTQIRTELKNKQTKALEAHLPKSVLAYISQQKLYQK